MDDAEEKRAMMKNISSPEHKVPKPKRGRKASSIVSAKKFTSFDTKLCYLARTQ
jgi:hypothetical protein